MGTFLFIIIDALVGLAILVLFANAIFSWLIQFDVVNTRNRVIYQLVRALDALSRPMLRPVQRFVPPFGGIDISPVIVIIVLIALRQALLPWIFAPIIRIIG